MHLYRTRFARDIVCEFLPPLRVRKRTRVVIVATGAPGYPRQHEVARELASKGFWVFIPRYRGSWESGGEFLAEDPTKDIIDVIDGLHKSFTELWGSQTFSMKPDEIVLLGGSFGGAAVLLASKDARVDKVVAIAPVVDWTAPSHDEPLDWLYGFFRDAFGEGYRLTKRNWKKLATGRFFQPIHQYDGYVGGKILILHNEDDRSVRSREVKAFAKRVGARYKGFKRGGHGGTGLYLEPKFKRSIDAFLNERTT